MRLYLCFREAQEEKTSCASRIFFLRFPEEDLTMRETMLSVEDVSFPICT